MNKVESRSYWFLWDKFLFVVVVWWFIKLLLFLFIFDEFDNEELLLTQVLLSLEGIILGPDTNKSVACSAIKIISNFIDFLPIGFNSTWKV